MGFNRTLETSKVQAMPAPFPNTKGTVTLKVMNGDQSLGPALAFLRMEPGSEIARHLQERTTETLYVIDGDFINEGTTYPAGTELNVKPMTPHGPHTTKTGCSLLVMFSYPSVLDDFKLTQPFVTSSIQDLGAYAETTIRLGQRKDEVPLHMTTNGAAIEWRPSQYAASPCSDT